MPVVLQHLAHLVEAPACVGAVLYGGSVAAATVVSLLARSPARRRAARRSLGLLTRSPRCGKARRPAR